MYCPVCGAEYRPGFSVCSDCQVALVPDPPASAADTTAASSSFLTLWAGDDPLTHAEVCEALDSRKIPSRTMHREDRSFNVVTQPAFEVFVPPDALDSARAALKDILAAEEAAKAAPDTAELQSDEDEDDEKEAEEDQDEEDRRSTLDLDPLDATVEIWSGDDRDMASMIVSSLRENKILCRSESGPHESGDESLRADESKDNSERIGPSKLLVLPQDERRAKEIVREILDAAPPE